MPGTMLAVFDFDHTMIEDNSDVVACEMINRPKRVPNNYTNNWTQYMQSVFQTLKSSGVSAEQIINKISSMSPTRGIPRLMRVLSENNVDIIVASDSNQLFIRNWLESNNLLNTVKHIYTNPAKIENGLIQIQPYELQTACELCTLNMCKGTIVKYHISQPDKNYKKILYFGDGKNDLCPVLDLTPNDIAFPRIGFTLQNLLHSRIVNAKIVPWYTGDDIYNNLKSLNLI